MPKLRKVKFVSKLEIHCKTRNNTLTSIKSQIYAGTSLELDIEEEQCKEIYTFLERYKTNPCALGMIREICTEILEKNPVEYTPLTLVTSSEMKKSTKQKRRKHSIALIKNKSKRNAVIKSAKNVCPHKEKSHYAKVRLSLIC